MPKANHPPAAVARRRGFTLIELVLVIILLGLLGAVGVTMISDSFTTTQYVNASQESAARARAVLERLEREIRETKKDGNAYAIATTPLVSNSLTFTKSDGETVIVDYTVPPILKLNTETLSSHVDQFSLAYKQPSETGTYIDATDATNVRFIEITLRIDDASGGIGTPQHTRIALRN